MNDKEHAAMSGKDWRDKVQTRDVLVKSQAEQIAELKARLAELSTT